ncbi:HNH endonuclease [Phaeocystidibacter marisrubri]|uniref:HNH nuclease domain-containing protein n=1 Tax=Phaeocystidibacter marisrubri TaxID=1577780 RepID=A0A6L3ZJZ1_9FLAO|nr:HNH endonuclease [Phaeocystidibacter marisrubri]KAB2817735.1 hypothetical protein F8C82_04845 [Phaeocystidibacter marisrubri]GGH73848.1 hypothetical protein GCM10011318_19220 [Phaeocystidibacter marisrubri]
MPTLHKEEKWVELSFPSNQSPNKSYAVSNHGRVRVFDVDIKQGRILRGGIIGGYPSLKIRIDRKDKTFYIHKLVGEYFVDGQSEERSKLIHLDFDKKNNHVSNLRWVTKAEALNHHKENPAVIAAKKIQAQYVPEVGHKLTTTDVMRIKKKIWDPNRKTRLRLIAKQFGISEMQLYRIKSGENWSHIRVENEPDHTLKKK